MERSTLRKTRPHQIEGQQVFMLGFILLCNSLALQNSFITSVSGFLSKIGANEFLIVSLVTYCSLLVVMSLQVLTVDRLSRMTLIKRTTYSFIFTFVVIRLMFLSEFSNWFKYSFFCLTTEIQWLIFPLVFWIFANSVFTPSEAKRVFPIIGAWGIVGNLLGIGISTFLPATLDSLSISSDELITVNIVVYALILICLESRLLSCEEFFQTDADEANTLSSNSSDFVNEEPKFEVLSGIFSGTWKIIQKSPVLIFLMYSILMLSFCDAVIEFHFLSTSISTYSEITQYQFIYGSYRLILTILGFVIQAFISRGVIQRIGLKNTFLIVPIAIIPCLVGMIVHPGIVSSLLGILAFRLCWDTIGESGRKSFYGFIPNDHQGRVSLFLDGHLLCLGNIVGFGITGLIVLLGESVVMSSFYIYLSLATIASLIALWSIMHMRTMYDRTILSWHLQKSKS